MIRAIEILLGTITFAATFLFGQRLQDTGKGWRWAGISISSCRALVMEQAGQGILYVTPHENTTAAAKPS